MENKITSVKDMIDKEVQESLIEDIISLPDFVPFRIIPHFVNGINMVKKRNDFIISLDKNLNTNKIIQMNKKSRKNLKAIHNWEKREEFMLKEIHDFVKKYPQFDGILKR